MSNYAMVAPLKPVSDKSPILSLLIILLVVMIGGVVGSMLANAITSDLYDGNFLRDLQNDSLKPGSLPLILISQGISAFIGLIFFPLLYITQVEHKKINPFFPAQPRIGKLLLLVAVLGVSFPIAISPLTEWNVNLKFPEFLKSFEEWAIQSEEALAKLTEQATNFTSLAEMLLGVFVVGLLPAIGEELVFRGMIQREFWRATLNIHVSIWLTAAIFSAIHLQFFGFFPRLLLGALFGYLYYWSGNLLIPIFSHFINNAAIVVMVYLNKIDASSIDMESNEAPALQIVVFCFLITGALLYYIWKHYTEFFPPVERLDKSYPDDSPLA